MTKYWLLGNCGIKVRYVDDLCIKFSNNTHLYNVGYTVFLAIVQISKKVFINIDERSNF